MSNHPDPINPSQPHAAPPEDGTDDLAGNIDLLKVFSSRLNSYSEEAEDSVFATIQDDQSTPSKPLFIDSSPPPLYREIIEIKPEEPKAALKDDQKLTPLSFKPIQTRSVYPHPSEVQETDIPDVEVMQTAAINQSQSLSLGILEKVSLGLVAMILISAASYSVWHFYQSIPTRPLIPISEARAKNGTYVNIHDIESYWRKPITEGKMADRISPSTKLLPELKLQASASSAAIRVFFRDENGIIIGDPINRSISGKEELLLTTTTGLKDLGDFAANRIGKTKFWRAEIFEAPNRTSKREEFLPLMSVDIPAEMR